MPWSRKPIGVPPWAEGYKEHRTAQFSGVIGVSVWRGSFRSRPPLNPISLSATTTGLPRLMMPITMATSVKGRFPIRSSQVLL